MNIKDGFGSKPLRIDIVVSPTGKGGEIWIEQHTRAIRGMREETLSYATLEELIELRDEVNIAIAKIAGVKL